MRGSLAIKTEQPRHHDWGQAAEDGGGDIVRKGDPSKRASTQRIPGMVERANEMHLAAAGIGIARIDTAGDKCPNGAFGAAYGIFRHHRSIPWRLQLGNPLSSIAHLETGRRLC